MVRVMVSSATHHHPLLATHAVLIGLTPLIPIPFLDDAAEATLRRSLVRTLASSRGVALGDDAIAGFVVTPSAAGAVKTAAFRLALYPAKKLFRKAFFALEGKRIIDLTSRTYCTGYLIDVALQRGWVTPDIAPSTIRAAAEEACRRVGTSPVELAVRSTFEQSKAALGAATEGLSRLFGRGKTDATNAAHQVKEGLGDKVGARLEGTLEALPGDYFDRLTHAFADVLGKA